jgi:hypothetical protein
MANKSIGIGMDDKKICARIDLDKLSRVSDVELGEEVTITIKGKVNSMRGPEEGLRDSYTKPSKKEKYHYHGNLEIEISSLKIQPIGEFDGMMED